MRYYKCNRCGKISSMKEWNDKRLEHNKYHVRVGNKILKIEEIQKYEMEDVDIRFYCPKNNCSSTFSLGHITLLNGVTNAYVITAVMDGVTVRAWCLEKRMSDQWLLDAKEEPGQKLGYESVKQTYSIVHYNTADKYEFIVEKDIVTYYEGGNINDSQV